MWIYVKYLSEMWIFYHKFQTLIEVFTIQQGAQVYTQWKDFAKLRLTAQLRPGRPSLKRLWYQYVWVSELAAPKQVLVITARFSAF